MVSLGELVAGFEASWGLDVGSGEIVVVPDVVRALGWTEAPRELRAAAEQLDRRELRGLRRAFFRARRGRESFTATLRVPHAATGHLHLRLDAHLVVEPSSGRLLLLGTHEVLLDESTPSPREEGPWHGVPYALVIDRNGIVHDYFHALGAAHNIPADRMIGNDAFADLEPGRTTNLQRRFDRALETQQAQYSEQTYTIGGELRTFVTRIGAIKPGLCLLLARDVTENARFRDRALQARYDLERVTAAVPGCVYQYRRWPDGSDAWTFVSRGSWDIWGVAPETVRADPSVAWRLLHPDDRERFQRETMVSMRELTRFESEARLIIGETVRYIRAVAAPAPNQDGSVTWTGFVQDVTAQWRAEEERRAMEGRMLTAQKLESLGLLAGGIAHDFNNLLVGVLGNAALIRRKVDPESALGEFAEQIELAARRMADVTRQMLAYTGHSRVTNASCELGRTVRDTAGLVRTAVPKAIAIEVIASPIPIVVAVDAGQVSQILMNLIINGAEAIGERRGKVEVSIATVHAGPSEFAETPWAGELSSGRYARLTVRDDGAGMDAETKSRAFDPFFSTKFTGRGLGLAAVLGILKAHRGAARIESAPSAGTRFDVYLPLASTAPPADEPTTRGPL